MTAQFEIFRDGRDFRFRPAGAEREILRAPAVLSHKARSAKRTLPGRGSGVHGTGMDLARIAGPKLKFLIRLDLDMNGAHIQVRGRVTERNLKAVYAVARRTSTIVEGLPVVLDLRQATVGMAPLGELRSACLSGEVPSATGSASTPCRLEILEPAAG